MKFSIILGVAVLLLGAGWFELRALREHNALRRVQVAELRRRNAEQPARREEPARSSSAGHRGVADPANGSGAGSAVLTEAAKIRAEIAALEQRATERYALNPEATDAPPTNRDPENGMTRLEYFQNVGQATPAAAFQTLVWAALHGEDKIMAQMLTLDESARGQVQELMARNLTDAERERYSTPESVLALFLAKALVRVSSLQITQTGQKDPANAVIEVRGLMGNDQHLPMRLGPSGWQLLEGARNVEWLRAEFAGKGN